MRITLGLLFFLYTTCPIGQSGGVGEVAFSNSGSPAAQSEFLRALAQLHNFEYQDAAEHFRRAEEIDPGFAMAYWGEAMTKNHGIWHQQDLSAAREVLSRFGATPEARRAKAPTEREKEYFGTIEILYGEGSKEERDKKYEAAMSHLHQQYPEDVDAAAFYALAILSSAEHGRDLFTYMRAAAVLEDVFPRYSHHPGVVHYLIHSYDDPVHAPLGLRAARIYARLAPEAGHAQHMTSHIFLALGMWDEVVKANETAMAVVNRKREAAAKPAQSCGHYYYWLQYGYLQQGRVSDARAVLEGCREQAQREASDVASVAKATADPDSSSVGSYSEMRANYLIDSESWQEDVAQWTVDATDLPFAQVTLDYVEGLVAYKTSHFEAGRQTLLRMESHFDLAKAWLDRRHLDEPDQLNRAALLVDQLRALLSSPNEGAPERVSALESVATKENALPIEFGPPSIYKPTSEILGELYLDLNKPAEARRFFVADLARAPGRRLGVRGLTQAEQRIPSTKIAAEAPKPANGDHVHR